MLRALYFTEWGTDMRWSAGGAAIAINYNNGLWLAKGNGSGLRELAGASFKAGRIQWARNGSRILFTSGRLEEGESIMLVDPATNEVSHVIAGCVDGYRDQ